MPTFARTISARWANATNLSGVTTASLLVIILVSTVVGAVAGLALSEWLSVTLVAIIAGFLGTMGAAWLRNTLLVQVWEAKGVEDTGTPIAVVIYAAVASLAGSLAVDRVGLFAGAVPGVVTGAFAGLVASALFVLLVVAYRMNPKSPADRW